MKKRALITGITGQDGSFLAEFLLEKGYEVFGVIRRNSTPNTHRIKHLLDKITLIPGDMTDGESIYKAVETAKPHEFYNLAAQSYVAESWCTPYSTCLITGMGVIHCLEAIRKYEKDLDHQIKFYQAGSSEQYGLVEETPQSETTAWHPRSPYACAKVFAHELVRNYRESYGLHASVGILFNHESERRGEEFVTKKITNAVAHIMTGKQERFSLGNMDAKRDWGYAKDYVEGMWMMLQMETPDDYVIGTGETHSVRDFVVAAFKAVDKEIIFEGEGLKEKGYVDGTVVLEINEKYYRPAEVDLLLANPTKARTVLNWTARTTFDGLVKLMVEHDLRCLTE